MAYPAYPGDGRGVRPRRTLTAIARNGVRARYAGARFGPGRGDCPSVTLPRASIAPATWPAGACGPCAGCECLSGGVMTSPAGHLGPEARRARCPTRRPGRARLLHAGGASLIHVQLLRLPTLRYSSPRAGQPKKLMILYTGKCNINIFKNN